MNYVAWTSLNLTAFSSPLLAPSLSGFFSSPTRTHPTWTSLRHLSFPAREPAVSISPPYLLLYPFLPSTLVALVFSGMEADLTRGLKARSVTLAMRFGCLASIRYSQLIGHWVGCLILGSLTRSIRLSISNLHHSMTHRRTGSSFLIFLLSDFLCFELLVRSFSALFDAIQIGSMKDLNINFVLLPKHLLNLLKPSLGATQ